MIEVKVKETMEEIGKAIKILEEARDKLVKKKSFRPKDLRGGFVAHIENGTTTVAPASSYLNCDLAGFYENGEWRATKEGIERMLAYDQALHRIKAWKAENCEKWVEGEDAHVILYNHLGEGGFEIQEWSMYYNGNPVGHFASKEDGQNCFAACHDDLLIVILDGYK